MSSSELIVAEALGLDFVFDRRVIERNIFKGMVSQADFDKHIAALPDLTASTVIVSVPIVRVSTRRNAALKAAAAAITRFEDQLYGDDDLEDEDDADA